MKHRIKSIAVPAPCTEDWNNMLPDAKGRFCSSCQKAVTDFSGMTNAEILIVLSTSGNICGKFGPAQLIGLNSELVSPKRLPFWKKLGVAATIAALAPFLHAKAQVKTGIEQHIPLIKKIITDQSPLKVIKGKVVDAGSKKPIDGAEIRVKGNAATVMTDAAGNFEITTLSNQDTTLVCSYVGHIVKETDISKYQPFYNIEISANNLPDIINETCLTGLVGGIVVQTEVSRPNYTDWLMMQIFR